MSAFFSRIQRRRPLARKAGAFLLVAALFTPAIQLIGAASALPPASGSLTDLDLNFGVFDQLEAAQARKAAKTDPAPILEATDKLQVNLTPREAQRVPPAATFTVRNTTQGIPETSTIFDVVESSPLPPFSTVLQFFLDSGALGYLIHTNCSGITHWTPGYLRPTVDFNFSVFPPRLLDRELWQPINCDDDTSTGVLNESVDGADLRVRLVPILTNINPQFTPGIGPGGITLNPHIDFLGGLSIEVERLGPTSALPVNLSILKSFSYDNNNYVWFVNYDFPDTPRIFNNTFTSDEISLGGNLTNLAANFLGGLTGQLPLDAVLTQLRGPYRLGWNYTGELARFSLQAGYARFTNSSGTVLLRERTWFDVTLTPAVGESWVPSVARVRLSAESFDQSFDYLEWNASRPTHLDAHYFDDRENFTYARVSVSDLPPWLQANVDQIGSGENATARIVYQAADNVSLIDYDEYIFLNRDPKNFIYSHVRLEDLPRALIVNGTLDVGGTTFEPQFLPQVGVSPIGELIDRVMIRISSKLYAVGQTLRAIPNNILNLPNEKGWVSIDLPQGGEIGQLEFWLSSGSWAVAPGDFVAFYNDTSKGATPGPVGTAFAGRLQHIEKLMGGFIEDTQLTLVTGGTPLPLTILFLDTPEDAIAVARIKDLPPQFSLHISGTSMTYAASGPVAELSYTSQIGAAPGQYTRILLQDLPAFLAFNQTPGDVRVDTLVNGPAGAAGIGLFELQVSNGIPFDLPGDHLLSYDDGVTAAASARIHDISSLRYVQGAGGKVRFTAKGGEPFSIVFLNRSDPQDRLETFLNFDPLPSTLDVTLPGSLQSVNPIALPSLGSLSSVADFSRIIFGIDAFGKSVASMLGQVGANLANGIGRFDQDFSFGFDSTAETTITANISKGDWKPADEAQWVHGLRSKQRVSPHDPTRLDLNAKLYLTGLPHHMDFSLNVEAEILSVNATMLDFTPKFDYLAIETDAASTDLNDSPKNIRFFTDGILPHTDIALKVDFLSDLTIGGAVIGNMTVNSTYPLQDFYVRLTTARPRPTSVEVFMPEIPEYLSTRAEMAEGISITHRAVVPLDFVFIRMARGIVSADASAYAVFHDVPPQANIEVPAGGPFDMSSPNPFKTLPNITMVANEPGLDLLADLRGDALGSRGSLRFLALDLGTRLTMTQTGLAYSIASDGVQRLLLDLAGFPISKGISIDAASIYAENVSSASISTQLIFNSLPIVSVDHLSAEKLQITFEHRINALSGAAKPTTFVFVTVPIGTPGPVSVASNGIVTSRENSGRYLVVPAPALSWILSQL